jgi:hypothetical protein
MNEEEKKIVSQIKDVAQYKTIVRYGDGHDTIAWIPRPEQTMVLNNYTAKILYDLIEKQQKENQELKKRINKAVGIMNHLDSLDAEQFYEVDQVLKGAENHIPRID